MEKNKGKFRFFDVLTLSFAHMAHDLFPAFLSPILPLLKDKLSLSYTQTALFNVIRGLPSLLNPFIGYWVDKRGGKAFVILGPTLTAIFMTLIGLVDNYSVLVFLLLLAGINSTFFHVPLPVMVKKVSGNKSGLGMSFFMVGGELARSLGPILVLGAVSLWKLEGIWRLIPLDIFASVLLFFRLRKIEYPKLDKTIENQKFTTSLKKIIWFFVLLFVFMLFVWLMKISLTYFLPTYLKAKGNTLWFAGISLSVIQFAGLFGAMWGGYISDKIGRTKTLLIAWIVSPLLMQLFLRSSSWFAFVLLVLLGLFLYTTTPVMLAYVHDLDCKRPSFVNSMFMISNFGASALATLVVGFLSDKMTIIEAFRYTSWLGFLTIPFIFLLQKEFNKINKN